VTRRYVIHNCLEGAEVWSWIMDFPSSMRGQGRLRGHEGVEDEVKRTGHARAFLTSYV
jgi:hypothetical protein